MSKSRKSNVDTLWYTRCPVPTPLGVAARLGWIESEFKPDGISIRTLQDESDPKLRESHFDHHLENSFRQGGNIPAIWARSRGKDTRVVGLTWTDESQLILTKANSPIHGVGDLKGKRLGVATRPNDSIDFWKATTIRAYLAALATQGLSVKDVELVELPRESRSSVGRGWGDENLSESLEATALASGAVDVIYHKGSRAFELADAIGARVVYDLGGHPDPKVRINNGSPRTLTVDRGLIDRNLSLVVRLVKKVVPAGRWAEANRIETIHYIAQETRSSESAVIRGYGKDVHRHLHTDLSEASIDALADFTRFLAEWKLIPSNFDVRSWIDPRPLEQALAQIELEDATTAKGNSASAVQANL